MLCVGLTGGISCGKSTVAELLTAAGLPVVDCDRLAHAATAKGTWGHHRVVAAFGREILQQDGSIDRQALGRVVFSDSAARRRLNKATHLPVLVALLRALAWAWLRCERVVVVDMPLLFETGAHRLTSLTVVVACSGEAQLRRLMQRDGCSAADASARIDAQMPVERKVALADVVVWNDGGREELQRQVSELAGQLRGRGARWTRLLRSPPCLMLALLTLPIAAAGLRRWHWGG